jgi:hypothetical protein
MAGRPLAKLDREMDVLKFDMMANMLAGIVYICLIDSRLPRNIETLTV